jgi:hypothetical protein
MAIAGLAAHFALGWTAAAASVVLNLVLLVRFCWSHQERFFWRCFLFGLAAGVVELLNDTWLVSGKHVLVYPPGGPFVLDSPLYMPFTWALIFVTLGAVAVWLVEKTSMMSATLGMVVLSMLYIPGFEAVAKQANWWHYQNVPMMLGLAPWFVVVGEGLLAIPLAWWFVRSTTHRMALLLGAAQGLVIWLATVVAFWMCG